MQYGTMVPPGSSASSASVMLAISGAPSGASSEISRCAYSQLTSGPVSSSNASRNSSSKPGSTRPSTYPVARSGMTLTLYPADS